MNQTELAYLNDDLRKMAEKMLYRHYNRGLAEASATWQKIDDLGQLDVIGVHVDGNFTIVTVDYRGQVVAGTAKRNPKDAPDPQRGIRLAASRALKQAFDL